jgi:ATP-binding cassette subfamily B protein
VVVRQTRRQHAWRLGATPAERRAQYYDWLQTSQGPAAELRLFALGTHFREAFQHLRGRLRGERIALAREQAMAEIGAGAIGVATTALAVAWMARRAVQGLVTLGDVALLYQAFQQGQRLLRSLLEGLGQVYGNSLSLDHLFEFLALEPELLEPARPIRLPAVRQGLTFETVAFRYPGSERPALEELSLTFPAGQLAAIIGANGAGKTTLIKLACRLYDPDEGRILLDGVDLRDLPLADLRSAITVLFQQPLQHQETAARNVAYGDLAAAPAQAAIEDAARGAGADAVIRRLPAGYETLLGKWFGGADLSVGEWQRLALARAFLRDAPIVLLDEPTSAMDSWAEADWLARLRTLVAGRVAIVITHRLTTARRADVIHVMEGGRVVESGTHEALLAAGGRYASSWTAQTGTRDAVLRVVARP